MSRKLTLVHAADLHLGHRFGQLPAAVASVLRHDEAFVLERLVLLCREAQADALLLAGDVFEDLRPDPETERRFLNFLSQLEGDGLSVFIAPGNHDPIWGDSPWNRLVLPDNVHVFSEPSAVVRGQACFYGAGFQQNQEKNALFTRFVPPLDPSLFNVLLLHGEPVGPGGHSLYNPIPLSLLENEWLDYAALGHVHATSHSEDDQGETRFAYSGALRGRGFDETGGKGALVVELEAAAYMRSFWPEPEVRPLTRRRLHFVVLAETAFLDLQLYRRSSRFEEQDLLEDLRLAAAAEGLERLDRLVVRLTLMGDYGDTRPSLPHLTSALQDQLLHLELLDHSVAPHEAERFSEHSLLGAFLRQSANSRKDEALVQLARDLGLEAFSGLPDLERYLR